MTLLLAPALSPGDTPTPDHTSPTDPPTITTGIKRRPRDPGKHCNPPRATTISRLPPLCASNDQTQSGPRPPAKNPPPPPHATPTRTTSRAAADTRKQSVVPASPVKWKLGRRPANHRFGASGVAPNSFPGHHLSPLITGFGIPMTVAGHGRGGAVCRDPEVGGWWG